MEEQILKVSKLKIHFLAAKKNFTDIRLIYNQEIRKLELMCGMEGHIMTSKKKDDISSHSKYMMHVYTPSCKRCGFIASHIRETKPIPEKKEKLKWYNLFRCKGIF